MISSRRRERRERAWASACLLALALAGAAGACDALEPADVLAVLARVERSDATFEETRHIAALTAPVVRRGSLRYVRPATLEMVVDAPVRERIRVSGDALTIEGKSGTRNVKLSDTPLVAAWVESVRATLAGDAAALRRYFDVRATGDVARWRLSLTPASAELSAVILRVTIDGTGERITQIAVDEASGDRSVTLVSPATGKP